MTMASTCGIGSDLGFKVFVVVVTLNSQLPIRDQPPQAAGQSSLPEPSRPRFGHSLAIGGSMQAPPDGAIMSQRSRLNRMRGTLAISAVALLWQATTTVACTMSGLPDKLDKPTNGQLTSGFGPRYHPLLNMQQLHDGVDYAAAIGTPVTAAADGVITHLGFQGDNGRAVEIAHGKGLSSVYGNLSHIAVAADGQCVKKGDVIGQVGCTGLCAAPHLHFGVKRHGQAIDPREFLAEQVPRFDPIKEWRSVDPLVLFDAAVAGTAGEFFDKELLAKIDWKGLAAAQRETLRATSLDGAINAVNQLLAELRTSHTRLFTPDDPEYYILQDIVRRPSMMWAGDSVQAQQIERVFQQPPPLPTFGVFTKAVDQRHFIDSVLEGSAAEIAGLNFGDEILTIDGEPYTPVAGLRGKVGKTVELAVRRTAGADLISVRVDVSTIKPADAFTAATVASARVIDVGGQRVGYIHIWASHDTQGLSRALDKIAKDPKAPLDRVIIDMRGKVGGSSGVPQRMLEALDGQRMPDYIGKFQVITKAIWHPARDHGGVDLDVGGFRPVLPPLPIASLRGRAVLLIDDHVRSAAEIMAHGFKRSGFGPVVGTPTAGAVTSGAIYTMPGGLLLYVGKSGMLFDDKPLEGVGVQPDHRVERLLPYAAGADPVLAAALELIAKSPAIKPAKND
jgi:carboxyl-terminal processing protease